MDGKKSKSEMLAKIAAMKQELARKKKKLRKSQRVANIKDHVQKKLKEFNENEKEQDLCHSSTSCEVACNNDNNNQLSLSGESDPKSMGNLSSIKKTEDGSLIIQSRDKSSMDGSFSVLEGSGDSPVTTSPGNIDASVTINHRKCQRAKNVSNIYHPDNASHLADVSLTSKEKFSKTSGKTTKEMNKSKLPSDFITPVHANMKHIENSLMIKENISCISSRKIQRDLINSSSKGQYEIDVNLSYQLDQNCSSADFQFESQFLSPSLKSQVRKELKHQTTYQHDHSNSQFLELLGLSQPIELTPVVGLKESEEKAKDSSDTAVLSSSQDKILKNQPSNSEKVSDKDRPRTLLQMKFSAKHTLNGRSSKSNIHTYKTLDSESDSLSEYTELDVISYSQLELTEDFLSENSLSQSQPSISQKNVSHSKLKPLIKRKSPRISATSYSSSSLTVPDTRTRGNFVDEKVAAVLSAFQYLIDEAKQQTDKEFQLPNSLHHLINQKMYSKCVKFEVDRNKDQLSEKSSIGNNDLLLEKADEVNKMVFNISSCDGNNGTIKEKAFLPLNITDDPKSLNFPQHCENIEQTLPCKRVDHSQDSQQGGNIEREAMQSSENKNRNLEKDHFFIDTSVSFRTTCANISALQNHHLKVESKLTNISDGKAYEASDHISSTHAFEDKNKLEMSLNDHEKLNQSDTFTSLGQNCSHVRTGYKSPKIDENFRIFDPSHVPSSSSTPIPNVKSKFKSFSHRDSLSRLSNGLGNLSRKEKQSLCLPGIVKNILKDKGFKTFSTDENLHLSHTDEKNESIELFNTSVIEEILPLHEDTVPSGQNVLKTDISQCCTQEEEKPCDLPLLASPISKCPDGHILVEDIMPWKKISRTPFTPLRIMEKETDISNAKSLLSPTFIYGTLDSKESLPRPFRHRYDVKDRVMALDFTGCFQSCSEDSVVQLLHCEVQAEECEDKQVYLVSIQASALTVWIQDVDGNGWIPEIDWRLSSSIHILEACILPNVSNKIAIGAYGWEENLFFATVFVYDVKTDITNRFNLPVVDDGIGFKNITEIHFCSLSSFHLLMGISFTTDYAIRSILFKDSFQSIVSSSMFKSHRGKLQALKACSEIPKACFVLTSDQRFVIWNYEIGAVLKSIPMPSDTPYLTGLLSITGVKGFLMLTVSWRNEKSDCGGIILLNPITGKVSKHCVYKTPNSGWKSTQNMKILNKCVIAVSSSGSVSWWSHAKGNLLGHRKSNSATCATLIGARSVLVGEVQGCVHIYSR